MSNEHPGGVRTYHTASGWSVADDGGWLPGIFDSEETALAALGYWENDAFYEMQKRVNYVTAEDRLITRADLETLDG